MRASDPESRQMRRDRRGVDARPRRENGDNVERILK